MEVSALGWHHFRDRGLVQDRVAVCTIGGCSSWTSRHGSCVVKVGTNKCYLDITIIPPEASLVAL